MATYDKEAETRRARRDAAARAASKVLSGPPRATMPTRLAQLAHEAEAAYQDSTPDQYGTGPVRDLERRTAELLGMEDAAFFPTGTMAQQVALRCWAGRTGNPVVALHPLAHPEVHERDALHALGGLRTVHPTTAPRLPTAEEIADFEEPFGTLMLELPLRDAGFVLPSWEELTAAVAAARERDAVVHVDGARLWECTPHFDRPLPEIAALADSVYVSYYKSLGGLSGAALAASADLIAEAKAWRHRYGGLLFQQYPAALAAQAGLRDELPRLASYVLHARPVAEALRRGLLDGGLDLVRVHPPTPHTHQFQLWLAHPARVLDEASVRQAERTGLSLFGRGVFTEPGPPGLSMTEVTVGASALEWTADEVHEAAEAYAALVAEVLE
jgi:threonine aldolase